MLVMAGNVTFDSRNENVQSLLSRLVGIGQSLVGLGEFDMTLCQSCDYLIGPLLHGGDIQKYGIYPGHVRIELALELGLPRIETGLLLKQKLNRFLDVHLTSLTRV